VTLTRDSKTISREELLEGGSLRKTISLERKRGGGSLLKEIGTLRKNSSRKAKRIQWRVQLANFRMGINQKLTRRMRRENKGSHYKDSRKGGSPKPGKGGEISKKRAKTYELGRVNRSTPGIQRRKLSKKRPKRSCLE